MKKNDILKLYIDDVNIDGNGIAHADGKAVFVQGALPGETVSAKIIKDKKSYAVARIDSLEEASAMRREAPCRFYKHCGGCNIMHASYPMQLDIKHEHVKSCIKRIAKTDTEVMYPLPSPCELRCRNKASFPVRMDGGILKAGFYHGRSHDLCDIDDCLMQKEKVAILMSQVRSWIMHDGLSIYDETEHKGLVRHIVVRTASSGDMMLTVVINSDDAPDIKNLLKRCTYVLPELKSIVFSHNTKKGNVILGDHETVAYGKGYLTENICGLDFMVSAHSFMQVNHKAMELLYDTVMKAADIKKDDTVIDLFCGIGTLSLIAAGKAKKVYGIEIVEDAVKNAEVNAAVNGIDNAEFLCGSAEERIGEVLKRENSIDLIIVDPPRKGLSPEVISYIAGSGTERIVYVSCDPATLGRDLALFNEKGYETVSVQPVDLFPNTTHIETVALLSRRKDEPRIQVTMQP